MKKLVSIFIFLLGIPFYLRGQIVTTDPDFPTADDSITVYFDATKGTAGLKNYTGDIYAHTGVITDQSTSNSDWKYVVTQWPDNVPKIKLERVETNLYKLNIGPTIREYYGVPDGETIEKMAFVFRNSDGSKEAKADGGEDIFADVYENSFNIKFLQPEQDLTFLQKDDTLSITGIGSSPNSNITLSLTINDQQVKQITDDTLQYTFQAQNTGRYEISLAGTDGSFSDSVSSTLIVNPPITDKDRPAYLEDGISYPDNSTARLSLFAPHKDFVYLIGDFNDWQIQPQYLMHRDSVNAASTYYWIEINNLNPGQEYGFQYLVDGDIRIADPYSHKVLDPNNDQYITDATYPNLKVYPKGKTDKIVGVLQAGKKKYNWQTSGYDRPEKDHLVIYELLIRDFIQNHNYQTLIDTLDYVDRLGVNAIELMPVMEFDGNISWGYNPTFHLAVDKYYGPADDLKRFIDACHSRGIAVILDMVLNHVYGPSPLVRLWNEGDYGKPTSENPYLNTEPRHDFNVGYDFNHESTATQYYVDRVNNYWLTEFHFDGFRFDLSKGFTQKNTLGDVDAWGQYDASRIGILERMADAIWAKDDSAYVILEHFAANEEEKELSDYGMMLWGNMNSSYNQSTMGYVDDSNFSGISYANRGWDNPNLVGYMESHDEERLMYKNLQYGNSDEEYDITKLDIALERVKMAGAFFFTVPGPKMIWQFEELGYDISIEQNGRTGEKPIKWEYYSDEDRKKLYDTFKALIRLRKSSPAFTSTDSKITMDLNSAAKRITIDNPDIQVSLVGNFGVSATDKKPLFAHTGNWYDFFSGNTLHISDPDTSVALSPGEFHIYTTQKFEAPEDNLLSHSQDDNQQQQDEKEINQFKLYQNYPNPFNPSTSIPYDLEEATDVRLQIFNILGQEVISKDMGNQSAGSHEIPIDAAHLSSGVYLYRLQAGSHISIKKMMLIK